MAFSKIYIIVLSYNRRDDTVECLKSLYLSDYPNYKVIVVDNASSDGSAEAVRRAFPQADVIENSENLMYAEGNNVGIRRALAQGADYVLLLNNDTIVSPAMLGELETAMRNGPDAGVAGAMIYYFPPKQRQQDEIIWYAGGILSFWKGLTAHRGIRETDSGLYKDIEETGYVTGCAMMLSRRCIERTGLLDPGYFIYAEDADLSVRARRAGFRLLFAPRAKVWHKVSLTTGGEFSAFKIKNKIKSNLRLFLLHTRPWHWLTIPFFVVARASAFALRRLFFFSRRP